MTRGPLHAALSRDLLAAQGRSFTRLGAWDVLSTRKESEQVRPFPDRAPAPARSRRVRSDTISKRSTTTVIVACWRKSRP